MDKLVKRGDTRHVINLPATRTVKAKAGNIFGVAYEDTIDSPELSQPPKALQPSEASSAPNTRPRRRWLRMPLLVRLWGRN